MKIDPYSQAMPVYIGSSKVLLLVVITLGILLHARNDGEMASTETLLHNFIVDYYRAIEENRLEEAVSFFHYESPELAGIRTEIDQGLSTYLQSTMTLKFDVVSMRLDLALATARLRFHRISGVKFSQEYVDVAYIFKRERGAWKLWKIHRMV